jgi:hypothetical protein
MRAISWPTGQAALQGAVFSSYLGWKKRHDPVLFTAVEVLGCGMNNGSFLNGESFMAFIESGFILHSYKTLSNDE